MPIGNFGNGRGPSARIVAVSRGTQCGTAEMDQEWIEPEVRSGAVPRLRFGLRGGWLEAEGAVPCLRFGLPGGWLEACDWLSGQCTAGGKHRAGGQRGAGMGQSGPEPRTLWQRGPGIR